jgi:DNA-damage-inducible protein J
MPKTATVRARIEPELKRKAEQILSEIGLKPSLAIQFLYRCIVEDDGFPVSLKRPNAVTRAALEEARNPSKLKTISRLSDLFDGEGSARAKRASIHKPVQERAEARPQARRKDRSAGKPRPSAPRRSAAGSTS